MKNSGTSSTSAAPPPPSGSARSGFALTGPTVPLDPLTNAVRGDLADVRLADRVFAPHYAAPIQCRIACDVQLRLARAAGSDIVAELCAGEAFEMLELAGETAWGIAGDRGIVGYLDAAALTA